MAGGRKPEILGVLNWPRFAAIHFQLPIQNVVILVTAKSAILVETVDEGGDGLIHQIQFRNLTQPSPPIFNSVQPRS